MKRERDEKLVMRDPKKRDIVTKLSLRSSEATKRNGGRKLHEGVKHEEGGVQLSL